jgi:ribosomal-protein-serine acetyltransferase
MRFSYSHFKAKMKTAASNFTALKVDDTTRLELLDEKHAAGLFAVTHTNRAHLKTRLSWVDNIQSVDDFTHFIINAKKRESGGTELSFAIVFIETVAGRIGIYNIDQYNKTGSIGYWLGKEFEGKGIVTKACHALMDYCFGYIKLNRIEIKCAVENYKSQAIPERLHFKKEGIVRQGEFLLNSFIDLYAYSMLKDEHYQLQTK